MRLEELAAAIPGSRGVGNPNVSGERAADDNREVRAGDVFVAIHGAPVDGAVSAGDAIIRGASAVAADRERPRHPNLSQLVVPDARRALGEIASALLDHPTEKMRIVGVTGTDGK